ncbi:alpha-(1,6)-fucosyltransferase-like isoform X2 [Clavelina lepadiformis]|uniref:alpha-(1,6)-fucosyltransferase-like isoform X2 n=1 Tax=Clavelina lepadiformis TaxID=159417 RepID=UPI004041AE7C
MMVSGKSLLLGRWISFWGRMMMIAIVFILLFEFEFIYERFLPPRRETGNLTRDTSTDKVKRSAPPVNFFKLVDQKVAENFYAVDTELTAVRRIVDEESRIRISVHERSSLLSRLNFIANKIQVLREQTSASSSSKLKLLGTTIQAEIEKLQNPNNCSFAKKLICQSRISCGFGCVLHHLSVCLLLGLATNRTVVTDVRTQYNAELFDFIQLPSKTCKTINVSDALQWNGVAADPNLMQARTLLLRVPLYFDDNLLFQPHWLFQDIYAQIRPLPWLEREMQETKSKLGLIHPIVGVHIRRSDHKQIRFANNEQYMKPVKRWFEQYQQNRQLNGFRKLDQKLVYIATDDQRVISDLQKQYKQYTFITNYESTETAAMKEARNSNEGLLGIISDITLLSNCTYIVGSFSSNVFRIAAELMQTRYEDASNLAFSIDYPYCLSFKQGRNGQDFKAVQDHKPELFLNKELRLRSGDLIKRQFSEEIGEKSVKAGYWYGTNLNTSETGLYPSYKVKQIHLVKPIHLLSKT